MLARNKAQLTRARSEYGDQVLSLAEAGERLRATRTLGATYTPDCAAIHPGRLVRGLAEVVTRRGVALYERTPAPSIEPGVVRTARGSVRAPYVVRATEGFTPRLPGLARAVVPVYSLIVATEPLPASVREPEPLRWLGINAGLRAMQLADAEETLTGRPSVVARVMAPLLGS